jgi:hypothetical protein
MRLALGPQAMTIYASLVWMLLYPVILLRYVNTTVIIIALYIVVWSYIVIKNIFIYQYSALSTCLWTLFWMVLVAVPFIPFGIYYYSLLRYNFQIYSNIVRIIPFINLLIVLALANYFYFRQKLSTALIWSMGQSLFIILTMTLSDLLPTLMGQPFFYVLEYRFAFINTLIVKMPIIVQVLLICGTGLGLVFLDKNFIAETRERGIVFRLALPSVVTIIAFVLVGFLRIDYERYRSFDYTEGIYTIFLNHYKDTYVFWFNSPHIRIWSGNLKMLYPFGAYDLSDTLQRHAQDLGSMTIIEGMELYKFDRILRIMAYGPRDTIVYRALSHILKGRVYHTPEYFEPLLSKACERFSTTGEDITVQGWLIFNQEPGANIIFCVNRWFEQGKMYFERIWQGTTDVNGHFEFTCFGGDMPATRFFQFYFILPAMSRGKGFEHVEILNIPPVIERPGSLVLDTIYIGLKTADSVQDFDEIIIETSMNLESIDMFFPELGFNKRIFIDGEISRSGYLLTKKVDIEYLMDERADRIFKKEIMDKVHTWSFHGQGDDRTINIWLNSERTALF